METTKIQNGEYEVNHNGKKYQIRDLKWDDCGQKGWRVSIEDSVEDSENVMGWEWEVDTFTLKEAKKWIEDRY